MRICVPVRSPPFYLFNREIMNDQPPPRSFMLSAQPEFTQDKRGEREIDEVPG